MVKIVKMINECNHQLFKILSSFKSTFLQSFCKASEMDPFLQGVIWKSPIPIIESEYLE